MTVQIETSILGRFHKRTRILRDGEEYFLLKDKKETDHFFGLSEHVTRWIVGRSGPGATVKEKVIRDWGDKKPTYPNPQEFGPSQKPFTHGLIRWTKIIIS